MGTTNEDEALQVVDGLPLIEKATELKTEGNAKVKAKCYNEAVALYERAIAVLDKADGHPMLKQEVQAMVELKTVLYSNMAQSLLNLELWRRAVEAATSALSLDEKHDKALLRRSKAFEKLRKWGLALDDTLALQRVGGGSLSAEELQARVDTLRSKKDAEDQERAKAAEESDDEADTALLAMKQRFDEVVEKYDLKDGEAAAELADWLTSGEWLVTAKRVAQRWHMEEDDAEAFLKWISKGLEFKMQNADAAGQIHASQASPQIE